MIENPIKRRPTRKIRVGSVYVGGDAPISIQSMTNTETCDVDATVAQIQRCADAGADIITFHPEASHRGHPPPAPTQSAGRPDQVRTSLSRPERRLPPRPPPTARP